MLSFTCIYFLTGSNARNNSDPQRSANGGLDAATAAVPSTN